MKNNHKISCVITLYNRQEFINDAIECVMNQSLKPHEIIIIDNSSKKINIQNRYLDEIKIFNIVPGAGIAQALNFGVSVAEGNYISFLEDDDIWPDNYLENVYSEDYLKYDYIVTPIRKLKDGIISDYKNPKNKINLNTFLISNPGVNISNLSIKKKSFFEVGGFDLDLITSIDKNLIIKFILKNFNSNVCEKVSIIKRFHNNNYTFEPKIFLKNLRKFYSKYSHIMSFKIKIKFLKKYFYYKFIKND